MVIFRRFFVSLPILVLIAGSLAAYWPLNDASASLHSAPLPEPASLYATGTFTTTLITDQSENLNATNSPPLISANGSAVVLLVPGSSVISSTTASYGFALYDLASRKFSPVSFTASRNEPATTSALSTDGRYVAFASNGAGFVANDTNGLWDVFVFDREAGVTSRVSVASNGTEGNGESGLVLPDVIQTRISLSADGRYVAFTSDATNLVANDTNNFPDVFVHDRQTGMTSRVSVASNGEQGLRDSYAPSLSADGRYVAFVSNAFNFAASRPGVDPTVYVHDRETGQTTPVSVTSAGDYVNNSYWPVISADAHYVAFVSTSPILVPPGHSTTERLPQIYIHDRETGETTLVSRSPDGTPGDARSDLPSISAHGRYVAFDSSATNLVAGGGVQGQALYNIYVHDRQTGLNRMVSITSDSSPIPLWSRTPSISGDGRSIAFAAGRSVYVHQPDYESDEEGGQCFPSSILSASTEDSDGDGLLDQWETCGYDVNKNDGVIDVDLPAMGADPKHKDIFVQVDYMVSEGNRGHTHEPSREAIKRVVRAFDQAPVSGNPDGKTGIHLHVDYGVSAPLTWGKSNSWGELSRSKPVAEQTYLSTCAGTTKEWTFEWNGFDTIKNANFVPERAPIFHYSVWVHQLCALSANTSGVAPGGAASDFVISLGGWTNQVGTANEQAGVFMHELGHNLGLQHGGNNGINRKPNYLSVMNYFFQTRGLIINNLEGNLDYSQFALPSLNENNGLNEVAGLKGGSVISNYGTRYYCGVTNTLILNASGSINWDCDPAATLTTTARANINGDIDPSSQPAYSILESHNDWPGLIFDGGSVGPINTLMAQVSSSSTLTHEQELTYEEDNQIISLYEVGLAAPYEVDVRPSVASSFTITISNLGTNEDSYRIDGHSDLGLVELKDFPTLVHLSPSTTMTIPLSFVASAGATQNRDTIFISVTSEANPLITDDKTIIVNVGSDTSDSSVFLPLISK